MSARAFGNQSELKRLAKLAKTIGVQVEVEFEGRILRIAPAEPVGKKDEVEVPSGGIPL